MAREDSKRSLGRRVVPAVVLQRLAVALLELLPAAAGAGVVSPDLRPFAPHGLHLDPRLRSPRRTRRHRLLLVAPGHLAAVTHLHRTLLRRVLLGVLALHSLDVVLLADLDLEELRAH